MNDKPTLVEFARRDTLVPAKAEPKNYEIEFLDVINQKKVITCTGFFRVNMPFACVVSDDGDNIKLADCVFFTTVDKLGHVRQV